jgi:hypothetical protein
MQIRVCDRCGVTVPPAASTVAVNLPLEDPATRPAKVTANPFPATLTFSIQAQAPGSSVDLCLVCLASVIVEVALVTLTGQGLTPVQIRKLTARIDLAGPA